MLLPPQKSAIFLLALLLAIAAVSARAQVANLKVTTDASPDYSDMESMVHSTTANWKTDVEKMYALFYWDHLARRHTPSVTRHGFEITDPIRQFNDYGYANYSSMEGIKCSEWSYMGYPCRLAEQYPEVWYDGQYHLYDNALSMIYSLADGKTIASAADLLKSMAGPETAGKSVPNYLLLYHALTATSPRGFIQGGGYGYALHELVQNFGPGIQDLLLQQRGHRYILNLRQGEVYTRYYDRLDPFTGHAIVLDSEEPDYKADPAAYVHNGRNPANLPGDPESLAPAHHIRGTGERIFTPILDPAHLAAAVYSTSNIQPLAPGIRPALAGKSAEAIFKVEGANVITSFRLRALASAATTEDSVSIALSTNQGLTWAEIWKTHRIGDNTADFQRIAEVNGFYDFLIKVTLVAKSDPRNANLKFISFNTWTQINTKTQPKLNLGANTIYVGVGDASNSIVVDPELQGGHYKPYLLDEKNIRAVEQPLGRLPVIFAQNIQENAFLIVKVDAPSDITAITYGGHFSIRAANNYVDLLHSFDNGKTWREDHAILQGPMPDDQIHDERITDVPPGTRTVLFKYALTRASPNDAPNNAAIYSVRMEVDHKLANPVPFPIEVTFNWRERQKDRSLVKRAHTQLIESFPATYNIDVGGADHPIVDSLVIAPKGARSDIAYGYSDGVDPGGEKWIGRWETTGKNLALGKPYTLSVPSSEGWGAGDPDHQKLTDGIVGSSFSGGGAYVYGALWGPGTKPEITVDLGQTEKCAAFQIHILGYPNQDAMAGDIEDQVEVLTSIDGKTFTSAGNFNFQLFKKDIPLNYMIPDNETLAAYNFTLPLPAPAEARYVKYKLTPRRYMGVTEVQVLDRYTLTPFDLKIALPDPATNGKASAKPDLSPNAKKWNPTDLPPANSK